MQYAGILNESLINGLGVRAVVFMQGCLHRCPGCHNPGTWPLHHGYKDIVRNVWDKIYPNPLVEGLTITGGEPFLQPLATMHLAKLAQQHGWNVMVYTGYTLEVLKEDRTARRVLKYVNWLVDGLYDKELKIEHPFYGSSNQRLIELNPLS